MCCMGHNGSEWIRPLNWRQPQKWRRPQEWKCPQNEDNLKNEDDLKNVVSINGSYKEPIHDYTICYRFLVEFYNDGIFNIFATYKDSSISYSRILDRFGGMGTGYESEGLQGGLFINSRNVSKGGLGGKNLPIYHNFVFPKDLDISKWYHNCVSYSNSLNHVHFYTDGLKAFSFNYHDDSEPLTCKSTHNTLMKKKWSAQLQHAMEKWVT